MSALWDSQQQQELELLQRILWLGRWMQTLRPRWADESFKADIKCVINNNLHVQPNTLSSTASLLLAGDSKCVSSHVLCYRGSWPQGERPHCGFWGTFVGFLKIFVQKMIQGALLVSDICSDLLGWPKTFSRGLLCTCCCARDVRPE